MWFLVLAGGAAIKVLGQANLPGDGVGASSPVVLVPLGVVTTMLVTIFVMFIKDQARSDQRGDRINAQLVASAESERDRAIQMLAESQAELKQAHINAAADKQAAVSQERDKWRAEIKFWQDRAEKLEAILYQRRTGSSENPSDS